MSQETWTHGRAAVNGIELHYVTQGQGPLLLLLHGWPEFWYSWRRQIPVLAEKFQVVAPDMRGFNDSDKPLHVSDYKTACLVGDVKGLVEHFGRKEAVIVGHDWGGAVAWEFAARHPEMTKRLAVLNCPHPGLFAKQLRHNFKQLRRSWYMFFFQLPWLPEQWIKKDPYLFAKRIFRGSAIRKEAFPPEELQLYGEALAKPGMASAGLNYYRAAFRATLRTMSDPKLPKIKSPTLLIWGEEDVALGKELTYGMEPYFDAPLQIHYIPRCGHWVQQEAGDEVNQKLMQFLDGL